MLDKWQTFRVGSDEGEWEPASYNIRTEDGAEYGQSRKSGRKQRQRRDQYRTNNPNVGAAPARRNATAKSSYQSEHKDCSSGTCTPRPNR